MYSITTACPISTDMWLFPVDFMENWEYNFGCDWSIKNDIKQRIDCRALIKRRAHKMAVGGGFFPPSFTSCYHILNKQELGMMMTAVGFVHLK